MAEQWLSIVEYARAFSVSDMTVRRRIKTGRLRAVLKEGKYYIPVSGAHGGLEEPMPIEVQTIPTSSTGHSLFKENTEMFEATRLGASHRGLVSQSTNNVQKSESSIVDSQTLLQFCEHSVTRLNSIERHLQDVYQAKIQTLEAEIRLKDQTISQLKEQVEDLQILVKLMEKPFKVASPIKA